MLRSLDPDVICLSETHLTGDRTINMSGYDSFVLNRTELNKKACRGSGGIAILVKRILQNNFEITNCYQDGDNVIGISLTSRERDAKILVYGVYLPPENSPYASGNDAILDRLTVEMYRQSESDSIYVCGDFNARVGDRADCLGCDDVLHRHPIDHIVNKQGDLLLTFVNDVKGCIINGRVNPKNDDFTSVTSYRGKAVVDYHLTRQCDLNTVKTMRVLSVRELVYKHKLEHLISDASRLPDHSLLSMNIELSNILQEQLLMGGNTLGSKNYSNKNKIYRKVGDSYMKSELAKRLLPQLLCEMDDRSKCQESIDRCCEQLTDLLLDKCSRGRKCGKRRKNTKHKPYWDDELTKRWRLLLEAERIYRWTAKKKIGKDIAHAKGEFRRCERTFDKLLKNKKRKYD